MAAYTTEARVRALFGLEEGGEATADLVAEAIAEAHGAVVARLDPARAGDPPAEGVVAGETWLAGAALYRLLALKEARVHRDQVVGGQRTGPGRGAALEAGAQVAEGHAWDLLAPCLAAMAHRAPASATVTADGDGED